MQIGWIKRKAANAMGWGVGKQRFIITQDEDNITVVDRGMRETSVSFVVGAGEFEFVNPQGNTELVTATWEDDDVLQLDNKAKGLLIRRFIEDGELVQTLAIEGVVATRRYKRSESKK